jgi:hypothetical protein
MLPFSRLLAQKRGIERDFRGYYGTSPERFCLPQLNAALLARGALPEIAKLELMRISHNITTDMSRVGWMAFRVESWVSTYLPQDPFLRHLAFEMVNQLTVCHSLREWLLWATRRLLSELDRVSGLS